MLSLSNWLELPEGYYKHIKYIKKTNYYINKYWFINRKYEIRKIVLKSPISYKYMFDTIGKSVTSSQMENIFLKLI